MIKKIVLGLVLSLFWLSPAFAKKPVLIFPGTNDVSANMVSGCLKTTLERAGYQVHTLADLGGDFPENG
ncbi:hypothetical protein COZ71_05465 [Candidatus Desantisbacteria bacterium CG_4_8_14_3_um_filter_40_12]|nr:MAG: hypothetical protein COZ71_05465 [Candidatus Desantisbacteria bacterium CG_4_8_14_3_um_filter_40_12]PIY20071.1 MAG: hypothetical protein COZ13_02005 [Candidatus Desantisbacteria bacterium CG_4_10_14_3_um_filter_40_18]